VEAIGRRRATAFAMPLLGLVQHERDPDVWRLAVRSLALLGTPDAVQGLSRITLQRRTLLGKGFSAEQRVEAVRALALIRSSVTRAALERVAREGDAPVKAEALKHLQQAVEAAG
jgi:HEAT repeat protein